jgi:hypothetical protein
MDLISNQYMVVDKIKYFNKIKTVTILLWLLYPAVYYSKYNIHLPYYNTSNDNIKKFPVLQTGISLIGGSNVAMGLSAKIISNSLLQCYNFGINSEGGRRFSDYINHIKDGISSSDIIIYSPFIIWSEQPPITRTNYFTGINFIPAYSIINQIRATFFSKSSNTISYDTYGDLENYNCGYNFSTYKMDYEKFTKNSNTIVEEIITRVQKIKEITRNNKVLIRIPPIYTNDSRKMLISKKMKFRIKCLKDAGIIVIGETICSSDKSLFCDNIHPNDKGRRLFSIELEAAIINIK